MVYDDLTSPDPKVACQSKGCGFRFQSKARVFGRFDALRRLIHLRGPRDTSWDPQLVIHVWLLKDPGVHDDPDLPRLITDDTSVLWTAVLCQKD